MATVDGLSVVGDRTASTTYWVVESNGAGGFTLLGSSEAAPFTDTAGDNFAFSVVLPAGSYPKGNSTTFANIAAIDGDTTAGDIFVVTGASGTAQNSTHLQVGATGIGASGATGP